MIAKVHFTRKKSASIVAINSKNLLCCIIDLLMDNGVN